MNNKLLEPNFDTKLEGYEFLGRGPEASGSSNGWERSDDLYFRCVKCGSIMSSLTSRNYSCDCGAMFVDADYHRLGSNYGDENILVYVKRT